MATTTSGFDDAIRPRIRVRRTGQGGCYGPTLAMDEVWSETSGGHYELHEAIADAVHDGEDAGEIEAGGQSYRWWIED